MHVCRYEGVAMHMCMYIDIFCKCMHTYMCVFMHMSQDE